MDKPEELENQNEDFNEDETTRIVEYGSADDDGLKNNVSDKLKLLFDLQKIDKELAEIEEEKGDLPNKITDLADKIHSLQKRLKECSKSTEKFQNEEKKISRDKKLTEDRANKFDEQKYNVRNNKEYDEITKMIDECLDVIEKNEARLTEINKFLFDLAKEQTTVEEKIKELTENKEISEEKLSNLNQQYEEEEKEYLEGRDVILKKLDYDTRSLYERINSSFKGEAMAVVRKGNCSGCYNSIPPQRVIEIRMAKHVFTCQSCGRILIDETLVSD